jgi:hypothetical protein
MEGVYGIRLECLQFHVPSLVGDSLIVFVRHKVLLPQGDCCPRLRAGLEHGPPLAIHYFPHTGHVGRTDFSDSEQSRWLGRNLRHEGLKSGWCLWFIPPHKGFHKRSHCMRCDLRVTYFGFPPPSCITSGSFCELDCTG